MNESDTGPVVKRIRNPKDIGKIDRSPRVMGGEPVIAGTRVSPDLVWSFHEDGYTTEQIIGEYPHLLPEDVEAAIAFETDKRRHGAA